jgi:hypothetical protein
MAKEKVNEAIAKLMFALGAEHIAPISLKILEAIKDEDVDVQILSVASLLLNYLDRYELDYSVPLGIADCLLYSGANGNMTESFKAQQELMKDRLEI